MPPIKSQAAIHNILGSRSDEVFPHTERFAFIRGIRDIRVSNQLSLRPGL